MLLTSLFEMSSFRCYPSWLSYRTVNPATLSDIQNIDVQLQYMTEYAKQLQTKILRTRRTTVEDKRHAEALRDRIQELISQKRSLGW